MRSGFISNHNRNRLSSGEETVQTDLSQDVFFFMTALKETHLSSASPTVAATREEP